jgi:hypothetical protein
MSDKDINYSPTGSAVDHYEKADGQERRRSSIADLNRNKNLDAKYAIDFQEVIPTHTIQDLQSLSRYPPRRVACRCEWRLPVLNRSIDTLFRRSRTLHNAMA